MTSFRLRFTAPRIARPEEAESSFYWLSDARSSFGTTLTPNLGWLGPVRSENVDLARIAVAVYAADRSGLRSARGSNWNQRSFELAIPVRNTAQWSAIAPDLEAVVGFLTGDLWRFQFQEDVAPPEDVAETTRKPKRVVLLSGGADSAVGALVSRSELEGAEEHVVLSHFSAPALAPIQRSVAEEVEAALPGPKQHHLQIRFSRRKRRLDGSTYPTESSSRSRSLLFLALGLAAASIDGVPLWLPENGFTSLNPPLGPDRRGSLSTRTTHPAFLTGLSQVLANVNAHNLIVNPFVERTKGEMFRSAANLVGNDAAEKLLSSTISCAHTGQRSFGISPSTPCGVCLGCVIRRASFRAAGLVDGTEYLDPNVSPEVRRWFDTKSVEPAVRAFLARGLNQRDLIAMNLPPNWTIGQALDLCRRSMAELSDLMS